ncbi:hypothetical protein Tco_1152523 [Tanacetum coccineum]
MEELPKVGLGETVPVTNGCCLGFALQLPLISPGYSIAISLVLVLPLRGQVLLEVAWSPTLKANDGIGICPLGSRVVVVAVVVVIVVAVVVVIVIAVVVVVICSCRPAPTVLGQVAKLSAVIACCSYAKTQFPSLKPLGQVDPLFCAPEDKHVCQYSSDTLVDMDEVALVTEVVVSRFATGVGFAFGV